MRRDQKIGYSLFWMMFLQWAILTIDFRAIASASYIWLLFADIITAALGFTIFKKIQEASTGFQMLCYVVGGTLGSQVALYLSVVFIK